MYYVEIKTTEGIETKIIEDIKELEEILPKEYEEIKVSHISHS